MKGLGTNRKDLAAGLLFMAFAALFAGASFDHQIGTALRMGPGFFPLIVAGLLFLTGLLSVVNAVRDQARTVSHHGPIPLRGLFFILLAPILFGATVTGLGLLPATAIAVLFGALASRDMSTFAAICTTAVLTVVCILIFWWGLGLPLRLFGTWLA